MGVVRKWDVRMGIGVCSKEYDISSLFGNDNSVFGVKPQTRMQMTNLKDKSASHSREFTFTHLFHLLFNNTD